MHYTSPEAGAIEAYELFTNTGPVRSLAILVPRLGLRDTGLAIPSGPGLGYLKLQWSPIFSMDGDYTRVVNELWNKLVPHVQGLANAMPLPPWLVGARSGESLIVRRL